MLKTEKYAQKSKNKLPALGFMPNAGIRGVNGIKYLSAFAKSSEPQDSPLFCFNLLLLSADKDRAGVGDGEYADYDSVDYSGDIGILGVLVDSAGEHG